jgi:hypothetical protein
MRATDMKKFEPVQNQEELNQIIEQLSSQNPSKRILFRGQTKLYENIRSGRARPNIKIPKDVDAGWRSLVSNMLKGSSSQGNHSLAKAILQHYGMATHFVDLTESLETAAWFATKKYTSQYMLYAGSSLRRYEKVTYENNDEDFGYIFVLAIDNELDLQKQERLFDLSHLPVEYSRPHAQKGWLMLDRPPTEPTPNDYVVGIIPVNCKTFVNRYSTRDLFPSPENDLAYAYFLMLPFVQIPTVYFHSDKLNESSRKEFEEMCLAQRALSIPEYCYDNQREPTNHKWDDLTIYEPHHMRIWKQWRFDLESIYPSIKGDIQNSVKITLSPEAKDVLRSMKDQKCAWPALDTEGLFFTYAALDHDKVIEHNYPYYGTWLQRDDDLIIETPVIAEPDSLTVTAGHTYFLQNGAIVRQNTKNSCQCDNPEAHDERVSSLLHLSYALEMGRLILLPHPMLSSLGWYIVISGFEGEDLMPKIQGFHEVVKTLLYSPLNKANSK